MTTPKILLALASCLALPVASAQAVLVTMPNDPAAWAGYMNVFELGAGNSEGPYVFGSAWGVPDLRATAGAGTLILEPNTNGYENTADAFWRNNGGAGPLGNKFMDAAIFMPSNGLIGQDITFAFNVDSFTFSEHTVTAFIRMFSAEFGVVSEVTLPITGVGTFSLTAPASETGAIGVANLQVGFNTRGINSSLANLSSYGQVSMSVIPEPSQIGLMLVGAGAMALTLRRRKR